MEAIVRSRGTRDERTVEDERERDARSNPNIAIVFFLRDPPSNHRTYRRMILSHAPIYAHLT